MHYCRSLCTAWCWDTSWQLIIMFYVYHPALITLVALLYWTTCRSYFSTLRQSIILPYVAWSPTMASRPHARHTPHCHVIHTRTPFPWTLFAGTFPMWWTAVEAMHPSCGKFTEQTICVAPCKVSPPHCRRMHTTQHVCCLSVIIPLHQQKSRAALDVFVLSALFSFCFLLEEGNMTYLFTREYAVLLFDHGRLLRVVQEFMLPTICPAMRLPHLCTAIHADSITVPT